MPAKSWGGSGRKKGGTVVVGAAILDLTAKFLQSDILVRDGIDPGLSPTGRWSRHKLKAS